MAVLALIGCGDGGFRTLQSAPELASSTTSTPSDPLDGSEPPLPENPVEHPEEPVTPTQPPDYNSDILTRVGLKLGPRGNSTCQLQPPLIPAFDKPGDGANVLKVCQDSGCPYQTISAALAAAPAGSVIAVKAGTYNECVRIRKNSITVQGRGGRPLIQASSCSDSKAIVIEVAASDVKLENLEVTDPTGDSATGVFLSKTGGNLNVSNLFIHHAQTGLSTVVGAGHVVVTSSYFDHLGHMYGTDLHTTSGLRVNLESLSAEINNVTITHPKQQGRPLFAAAYKNTINCVVAADLEGGLSQHLMMFTYGFDVAVSNSVLQRGPLSLAQMLVYWERHPAPVPDRFTATNNVFISDRPDENKYMLYNQSPMIPAAYTNNVFIGSGSAASAGRVPNSFAFESREAAGLGDDTLPYPGTTIESP